MKTFVKNLIRKTGFVIRRRKESILRDPELYIDGQNPTVDAVHLERLGRSVFFGYHDKIPVSRDGKRILANTVEASGTEIESECSLMEVGYFEKEADNTFSHSFNKIGETYTWSWQQGCMLQWNPLKPNEQVYYNKMVDGKHGSVLYDISKSEVIREFQFPIYSLDPTGRYTSSLNFTRLSRLRPGYGYRNGPSGDLLDYSPSDDGLYLMNLKSGETKMIVSLEDLAAFTKKYEPHYINHISFSPTGKFLTFFHIYHDESRKRMTRFYLYDLENHKLTLLEAANMVSHYCWRGGTQIFSTEKGPGGMDYFLYDLENQSKSEVDILNIGDLHPMFCPNAPNILVGDTKPDKMNHQHLFLFNIESGENRYVGSFHSSEEYRHEVRCDLHPRWDRKGAHIIVDTTDTGLRTIAVLKVDKLVDELNS